MSLSTFEWQEHEQRPIIINHHAQHVCKNTEKVFAFLEANTVNLSDSVLVHPWTGTDIHLRVTSWVSQY
jgi:hypothetical protein